MTLNPKLFLQMPPSGPPPLPRGFLGRARAPVQAKQHKLQGPGRPKTSQKKPSQGPPAKSPPHSQKPFMVCCAARTPLSHSPQALPHPPHPFQRLSKGPLGLPGLRMPFREHSNRAPKKSPRPFQRLSLPHNNRLS